MRGRSSYQPGGASASAGPYRDVFVRRVHGLLGQGYASLNPGDFSCAEEEVITGELARAVDAVLDDPRSPRWTKWFGIHEEARVHDCQRKGKRRRRLDIRIDSAEVLPRARLKFEAKRLGRNHGASVYFGKEGMRCFLDGLYAREESFAGMLGYVQDGTPVRWAIKLQQAMVRNAKALFLRRSGQWRKVQLTVGLPYTYCSGHDRPGVGHPIDIFHTILPFN